MFGTRFNQRFPRRNHFRVLWWLRLPWQIPPLMPSVPLVVRRNGRGVRHGLLIFAATRDRELLILPPHSEGSPPSSRTQYAPPGHILTFDISRFTRRHSRNRIFSLQKPDSSLCQLSRCDPITHTIPGICAPRHRRQMVSNFELAALAVPSKIQEDQLE